ncbi:polyketide cyclase [Glaciecola punicea]|nr:polyketide cyclase [Glaciecola punicea]
MEKQLYECKQKIKNLSQVQYNFEPDKVQQCLLDLFATKAKVQLCFPFEDLNGADGLFADAIMPLYQSMPNIERRDTIIVSGITENGKIWVGCCGYYCGTFEKSWLDIPATGHIASLRFHEFYQFEDNKVTEYQGIWDIPELMLQANAWPLAPSLGREWQVPAPASSDGIERSRYDNAQTQQTKQIVNDMCGALGNYASGGVEAMQLNKYWHPKCSWYGPSGIGTGRGISGFRDWHQIPFLNGLPDRVGDPSKGHLFADNNYAAFTAWPGMYMTVSGSGWLGIAPCNKKITMRSLDFWRVEGQLIRENWVLVDLLSVYDQIGVDVFARMREFNKAR